MEAFMVPDRRLLSILQVAIAPLGAAELARLPYDSLTIAAGVAACAFLFLISAYDLMKDRTAEPKPE
jgi:hypothetical protein